MNLADLLEAARPYLLIAAALVCLLVSYWIGDFVLDLVGLELIDPGDVDLGTGGGRASRRGRGLIWLLLSIPKALVGLALVVLALAPLAIAFIVWRQSRK